MNQKSPSELQTRFELMRQAWWPAIRETMDEVIQASGMAGSLLRRMTDYSFETGGKRLRAILPLLVADALGTEPCLLVPFGAACEMLHNASLVHDDLQDGDSTRRGYATAWKKFGIPQAINLGDAMIAYTILLMHKLQVPAILRERATCLVLEEMLRIIEGQVQDLELKHQRQVTLADYMQMVEGKTARLFALPMGGAALLCGASEEVEEGLVEAACHIGALFQIQDDILDIYGEKGRELSGNDVREGKRSVLAVYCLESLGDNQAQRLREILDKPRKRTTMADISEVRELFNRSGALSFAINELQRRRTAALNVKALAAYPILLEMLDEACEMFLYPIHTVMSDFALTT